jgi:hypothetical protein
VHHHSPSSVNLLHRVTQHRLLWVVLDPACQGHKPNGQKTSWLQLDLMPIFGLPQMLRGIDLYWSVVSLLGRGCQSTRWLMISHQLRRTICRMDLPRPTTSVGTRTDYSVGPWDYTACATRHLMAWSARTTEEKYSVRKLYMSRTVWKTPRRTRLVLSPYSDL